MAAWERPVLTAVAMTACSSSPTPNYYTMSPKITAATKSTVQVIEVLPVGIPDRLTVRLWYSKIVVVSLRC